MSSPTGWHIYCVIKDASVLKDLKAVRNNLLIRAWNAELGHVKISTAGRVLERCPIDLAVISPERLIFEAEPVLSNKLVKDSEQSTYIDGGYLL